MVGALCHRVVYFTPSNDFGFNQSVSESFGFTKETVTSVQSSIRTIQYLRGTMTRTTSFQMDIRPLFTERDIQGMSKAFNLGSYDDVKKHAGAIYDRIRGIGGAVMPPPPPRGEGPWPQSRIELFAKWMADGFQP
jgi:hypothetical protein